ncbi:thermonuclease family protein [Iodobacter sp. CM08]|uniref:thermonuclease family protein n=1 Tax=Iodobacter sp. CM08 TaxID=3085902 RepID=UPI002980B659|nr:thermonuclease family protein [Iodobacter sp. CM08]MDW5419074.1 thermonuclease family protein [Iodobacter sp. CM08]
MKKYLLIPLFLLAGITHAGSNVSAISGNVSDVLSADTFVVVTGDLEQYKIRLLGGVDEFKNNSTASGCKKMLSDILNKEVDVDVVGNKDKENRYVGFVSINGENINQRQVLAGCAVTPKKTNSKISKKTYQSLLISEEKAKAMKNGIWAD